MTQETKHYTMLSTQRGVRPGELHPVTFEQGKTYPLDDTLATQFQSLAAVEDAKANAEVSDPLATHTSTDDNWVTQPPINENVLDEDPAVLRHAEIPVEAVIAQNDAAAANGDMTPEAQVALGREDIAAAGVTEQNKDTGTQKAGAKKADVKPAKKSK